MKILVTGGLGFIGSHVSELLLSQGHEVIIIDNISTGRKENIAHLYSDTHLTIHIADIRDYNSIITLFEGIDSVIHLAALADIVPSIEQPREYYTTNVNGTFNVLEASRKNNIKKFIYIASSSCYGIPEIYPTPETSAIQTKYPYALTKFLGEQTALHWADVYKLPVISLRLFNVYGTRSRTSGTYGAVFGTFLSQKLHEKPYTVVGDGNQTRDFIFVTDVAQAIYFALQSPFKKEVFNVGTGLPQSINRLVELLKGEKIHIPKRPGEPDCTYADITKITTMLSWKPLVSFEHGVQIILKNIDYWKNAPVWTSDTIAQATKDWFYYLNQ